MKSPHECICHAAYFPGVDYLGLHRMAPSPSAICLSLPVMCVVHLNLTSRKGKALSILSCVENEGLRKGVKPCFPSSVSGRDHFSTCSPAPWLWSFWSPLGRGAFCLCHLSVQVTSRPLAGLSGALVLGPGVASLCRSEYGDRCRRRCRLSLVLEM